jgi:FkbM family methyltransferase
MSVKHAAKLAALHLGLEVGRYNAIESAEARLFAQLKTHRIDTIIDVGANDGGYGRQLRRGGFEGAILSFEPLEKEHSRLELLARDDDKWFVAPRMALGNSTGYIEIHVAGNSASSSILPMNISHENAAPESKYIGTQRIKLQRLDDVRHAIIDQSEHLLLKIDTQGFEMSVLEGAEQILSRVDGVQLELSLTQLYDGQVLYVEMIQWLRSKGLHLWNLIPGFVDPRSARLLQCDGVLFRVPG